MIVIIIIRFRLLHFSFIIRDFCLVIKLFTLFQKRNNTVFHETLTICCDSHS